MENSTNSNQKKKEKAVVKASFTIDAETKEVLDLLTKKANVKPGEIFKGTIKAWINNNLDLLTKEELNNYKHLIYGEQ